MSALSTAFDRLLGGLAAFAAAIFGATALMISVNVVLRNSGSATIFGLLDAVEYGILAATFLAAPWVLARNAHVTVDLLTGALPDRAARNLARMVALGGCLLSAAFLRYAVEAAWLSFQRGSMIRTAITIPEWWVLSVAPVAFLLICAEFLRQAVRPPARAATKTGL